MLFAPRVGRPKPVDPREYPRQSLGRPEPDVPDTQNRDMPGFRFRRMITPEPVMQPLYWRRNQGLADRAEYDAAAAEASGLNEMSPAWQGDYEPRIAMSRERALRGVQSIRAEDWDRRQKIYDMNLRDQERRDRLVQDWAQRALEGKKLEYNMRNLDEDRLYHREDLGLRREDIGLRREDQNLDRDLRDRQFGQPVPA